MPKEKTAVSARARAFPNQGFEVRNGTLWCTRCDSEVAFERKDSISKHIRSKKHSEWTKAVSGNATISSSGGIPKLDEQWNELAGAFVNAGIPLHVFRNEQLRGWMTKYVKNGNKLPCETNLRKKLDNISVRDIEKTKEWCRGKDICITVDETTDTKKRKVLDILVKPLEAEESSRLFKTKFLDKCDSETVEQEVIATVAELGCSLNNLLVLLSDNAPYMIRAGENLSKVCHRLTHSTCWAHVLHLTAEEIRASMPEADLFISKIKHTFSKAPARRNEFVSYLTKHGKKSDLPPVPVLTRWATWLEAGSYHWEHFNVFVEWIQKTNEKSSRMASLQKLMADSSEALAQQLERIHKACPGICSTIKIIEGNKMVASELWGHLQLLGEYLQWLGLPSEKLELYRGVKHPALEFWKDVQILDPKKCTDGIVGGLPKSLELFSSEPVPLVELLKYKNASKYEVSGHDIVNPLHFWKKYAKDMPTLSLLALKALHVPASSAEVERSFSYLKKLLAPQRMGLSEEAISSYLRITFNDDFVLPAELSEEY